MNVLQQLQTPIADHGAAKYVEVECVLDDGRDVLDFIENDRDFQDFIESISVTEEELAALITTPELTIDALRQRTR